MRRDVARTTYALRAVESPELSQARVICLAHNP